MFATASEWVARLAEAHHAGRLQQELIRLGRYPLIVIDEVGYIPFEPEAANLFFQLVSSCYERASLIVTSNKPFGRWGEVFGDGVVAAATEPSRDLGPALSHLGDHLLDENALLGSDGIMVKVGLEVLVETLTALLGRASANSR